MRLLATGVLSRGEVCREFCMPVCVVATGGFRWATCGLNFLRIFALKSLGRDEQRSTE